MLTAEVFIQRRKKLIQSVGKGLIVLFGNRESAMNYAANTYPFRQDSNFLYYIGIDEPDLAAVIDADSGEQLLYGDDLGMEDIIWMGYQEKLTQKGKKTGIENVRPMKKLAADLCNTMMKGRPIHYLPPYREERKSQIRSLIEQKCLPEGIRASEDFIKAIIAQRSIKDDTEIAEIEETITEITHPMYLHAMKMAKPGIFEYEISGMIEGIALQHGVHLAYPAICSVNGEILHNHYHGNKLQEGQLLLIDAAAESRMHYATDITRTIPVGGLFSGQQKDIYEIVLKAEMDCISGILPGIPYRDIHLNAAMIIAEGLKLLGLMRGNVSDIVSSGAHALFFPHGIGHMLGLDVHDMEDLGENHVGYGEDFTRSQQFGFASLRLARRLEPGFVLTVEPGIYFIPPLIDQWESEKKFREFINYEKVKQLKGFGGIRIEDNILVTARGHRILGKPIPKSVAEVEQTCKL